MDDRSKVLLEVGSDTIRRKHYSDRTKKATFNRYSAYIQLDRPLPKPQIVLFN